MHGDKHYIQGGSQLTRNH